MRKLYTQFLRKSAISEEIIPACGSDGIFYHDGRWARLTIHKKSEEICKQRKFLGYQLFYLDSLKRMTNDPASPMYLFPAE